MWFIIGLTEVRRLADEEIDKTRAERDRFLFQYTELLRQYKELLNGLSVVVGEVGLLEKKACLGEIVRARHIIRQ